MEVIDALSTKEIMIAGNGRYIIPYHNSIAATARLASGGRVLLKMFPVTTSAKVDAISVLNIGATSGAVIVGIYGPIAKGVYTCSGAALLVESSLTNLTGASTFQAVTFTEKNLVPGTYYAAVEYSNPTFNYAGDASTMQASGWFEYYDNAASGALLATCPVVSTTSPLPNAVYVRRSD